MAIVFILPVSAASPAHAGVSYPATFWAKMGKTNTVTGKVIASSNATQGLVGAYVAIVNASNVNEVYCKTTSATDGSYSFTGVNATYLKSHDPYDDESWYKIYAYCEPYGDGYSEPFGVDAATISTPMVVWVVITDKGQNAHNTSAAGGATIRPLPTATPAPATAETTPAPAGRGWSFRTIAIIAAIVVIALVGAGAYLYIRRR